MPSHSLTHSLARSFTHSLNSLTHVSFVLLQVDMYAGAIFIQQSLHLDLYLATAGLLAVTALYTVTGTSESGCWERQWAELRATPGLPGPSSAVPGC